MKITNILASSLLLSGFVAVYIGPISALPLWFELVVVFAIETTAVIVGAYFVGTGVAGPVLRSFVLGFFCAAALTCVFLPVNPRKVVGMLPALLTVETLGLVRSSRVIRGDKRKRQS